MRKKTVRILTVAALLCVILAGIGTAGAYFTTFVEASGSKEILLGDHTTVEEEVVGTEKLVTITNSADSNKAVWVRAKAFTGAQYESGLTCGGTGWTDGGDEFWYYGLPDHPLVPGESSEQLVVSIGNWPQAEIDKDFNVIVVYETIPAVEDGEEGGVVKYVVPTADDWNFKAD